MKTGTNMPCAALRFVRFSMVGDVNQSCHMDQAESRCFL